MITSEWHVTWALKIASILYNASMSNCQTIEIVWSTWHEILVTARYRCLPFSNWQLIKLKRV